MAAGAAVGVAYTLSPLSMVFLGLLLPIAMNFLSSLDKEERRWMVAIFGMALALRVAAIAGLFMFADPNIPYANLFGDEEFFKRRTTWLRNLGMGIPISPADYFYTFDQTGDTGYLYVLAYVQALFGLAPYGVHVMNLVFYLTATVILYRLVRPSFGGPASAAGITILLFLPSLFTWSISALKEPLYFFVVSVTLYAAVTLIRGKGVGQRLAALAGFAAGSWVLQSLREGGLAISLIGLFGGSALAFLVRRPRLLVAAALVVPLAGGLSLSIPRVQQRAWSVVHEAAYKHWGHVNTPGLTYKNLDDRFYEHRSSIPSMTPAEAGRFIARSLVGYVTVPVPWHIESRAALAFLPEQVLWYVMVVLVPFGAVSGLRRDRLLTSILIAEGSAVSLIVALSGGNIGTLVRHRDLSLPFFAWLAGLGAVTIARAVLSARHSSPSPSSPMVSSKAGLA